MRIKILGPGCVSCQKVEEIARAAVLDLGAAGEFEKVTNLDEIMNYPIIATPGLVINGELVCTGRIPPIKEVISWVEEALEKEGKAREYEAESDLSRGDEKGSDLGQVSQQGGHSK